MFFMMVCVLMVISSSEAQAFAIFWAADFLLTKIANYFNFSKLPAKKLLRD